MTADTPLTDAAVLPPSHHWEREIQVVPADFARHLERIIADAPHMERCDFAFTGKCVCWKSAARREG